VKLIPSIPPETDDVTSDFDNIVANAKDSGILFILLLGATNNWDLDVRDDLDCYGFNYNKSVRWGCVIKTQVNQKDHRSQPTSSPSRGTVL